MKSHSVAAAEGLAGTGVIILDIRWLIARGLYGEGNPCALLAVDVDDEHNAAQMQHKQRVWEFLRWISPAPQRR